VPAAATDSHRQNRITHADEQGLNGARGNESLPAILRRTVSMPANIPDRLLLPCAQGHQDGAEA
jgi:hypothetical protein